MNEHRFKELALDYNRWIKTSSHSKFVGDSLFPIIDSLYQEYSKEFETLGYMNNELINKLQRCGALADARAFHYGIAIENACKARLIYEGNIVCDGGKINGLRSDHNIEEMARQLGVISPESDPEFLKLITYQLQTLSKYPIAKSLKKQNEFTGRTNGIRHKESDLTQSIILQILKYTELHEIYDSYN